MPSGQDDAQTYVAELDRKIVELGKAIALNSNNADAYRNRGLIYGRKLDYDRALSDFNTALSLSPNDARAHALRGLVWEKKGESKRAIADFDRAIELDPGGAGIYRTHRERVLSDAAVTAASSKAGKPARVDGRFDMLLNPFVLLNVEQNATAQTIKQAAEDALEDGIASADVIQRAQQILLVPRLRVDAEVSGFLDVPPELAKHILTELNKEATYIELADDLKSLHALPRSNVLAHLGSASPMGVSELLQLLETQTIIAVGSVLDAVNETRVEAGSGKVDRDTVADALARLEEQQTKAVIDAFVGDSAFAEVFTNFVKRVLAINDSALITKLDNYVRAYNQAAAPELSRRREKVVAACDAVRIDPKNREAIDQIAITLRSWNEIEQPLQLFEAHMNREEPQARDLYIHVRDLVLWLANDKAEYETAKAITQACADVFSKLPRSLGQMQEESERLTQLGNQQTAINLLTPLSKICEEVQQNHRDLERELLRSGFSSISNGFVKTLYDEFSKAVAATKATDIADVPWRLVREIAISLNNDSQSPNAAAVVISGLVDFFSIQRPSKEMVETLEKDKTTAQKNIAQKEFEQSVSAGRWASAATIVEHLISLETDPNEVAAFEKARDAIAARRRSKRNKLWGWGAAAAVVLFLIATNQDNRPTYSPPSTYRPPAANTPYTPPQTYPSQPQSYPSTPPPVPVPPPVTTTTVDVPPVGTGLSFSQGNLRYCAFQEVRLNAALAAISSESARLAVNSLVDDWNTRCGNYRYLPTDKSIVDAEVISRRAALETSGRTLAETWATAPTFSKSGLTIDTEGGQRIFTVEMAVTQQQWTWGTSFRNSMPADAGMLYISEPQKIWSNGMRTVYYSLDVLFIDQNGKITEIYERRAPRSGDLIKSPGPRKAMLELNGGTTERLGIKVGDMVHTFAVNNTTSNAH